MIALLRSFVVILILTGVVLNMAAIEVGDSLADTELPLLDGSTIRVADLNADLIYLDIWATWCVPCRLSLPWMNGLQQRYVDRGLQVVAISIDHKKETLDAYVAANALNIHVGHDPQAILPAAWQISVMPTALILDRNGTVLHIHQGFRETDKEALEELITTLLPAVESGSSKDVIKE